MHTALLVLRLLLTSLCALAAVTKLADLRGSREAVAGFGVPEALAAPLGTLLPLAELAVALALLPGATARLGAPGAFGRARGRDRAAPGPHRTLRSARRVRAAGAVRRRDRAQHGPG